MFELEHIVQLAQPKLIVTSRDVLPHVQQAAVNKGYSLDSIFLLDNKTFPIPSGTFFPPSPPLSDDEMHLDLDVREPQSLIKLLQHGEDDWIRFSDAATAKSTPAALFSTSGTSGLPKSAISSHFAMVSQHLSIEPNPPYQIVRLMCLPFFHVFAALFVHVLPLRLGQQLYVMPRFELETYAHAIHQYAVTDTLMAPPMVNALNKSGLPVSQLFQSIRYIGVGGAPIKSAMMQQLESQLHPDATLSQVWGMTEVGAAMLLQYPERNGCDGSVGRPLPGYEMRLLDSMGQVIVDDHQPGELQVRYIGMMTGYKNQAPVPPGTWYSTGDLMSRAEGRYFVVGRSKELIKVNGFQVAPAEIEAVLLAHPHIADAAVIGALREDNVSEVPRAYIVRKADVDGRCGTLTAQEVYDFARGRLASYKALEGGVVFVDEIPKTATGKIQRFKLARMDQYRRSVTELLIRNCLPVPQPSVSGGEAAAQKQLEEIRRLKESAAKLAAEGNSSPSGTLAYQLGSSSRAGGRPFPSPLQPRRRSQRIAHSRHNSSSSLGSSATTATTLTALSMMSGSRVSKPRSSTTAKSRSSPRAPQPQQQQQQGLKAQKRQGRSGMSLTAKIKALQVGRLTLPGVTAELLCSFQ